MTIDRTYRCDLCHSMHKPECLIGLYWSNNHIVPRPSREVEHHICKRCLEDLVHIGSQQTSEAK